MLQHDAYNTHGAAQRPPQTRRDAGGAEALGRAPSNHRTRFTTTDYSLFFVFALFSQTRPTRPLEAHVMTTTSEVALALRVVSTGLRAG